MVTTAMIVLSLLSQVRGCPRGRAAKATPASSTHIRVSVVYLRGPAAQKRGHVPANPGVMAEHSQNRVNRQAPRG